MYIWRIWYIHLIFPCLHIYSLRLILPAVLFIMFEVKWWKARVNFFWREHKRMIFELRAKVIKWFRKNSKQNIFHGENKLQFISFWIICCISECGLNIVNSCNMEIYRSNFFCSQLLHYKSVKNNNADLKKTGLQQSPKEFILSIKVKVQVTRCQLKGHH